MGKVECKACGLNTKKKVCDKIRKEWFCKTCKPAILDQNFLEFTNQTKSKEEIEQCLH